MSARPKAGWLGGIKPPFALAGHAWLPEEWRGDFPPGSIVRHHARLKVILVRTGELRRHTKTVFELAGEGNPDAVAQLVRQTIEGCRVLKQLAETKPQLLRPYTRRCWQWPILKSLHPQLSDDHDRILKTLELGEDTPLEISSGARWVNDAAHKIAFHLLNDLWLCQRIERRKEEPPVPLGDLVDRLPPFNKDTALAWWKIAEQWLLFSYPEPESVAELDALVTAKTHRLSPGRRRERILEKIQKRFLALARIPDAYRT